VEEFLILGVRHVGFVVKSIEISQRFYEELGFEAESDPKEEFGPKISKLVGIQNVRIKTLKLRLKNNNDSIWREGGFRFELIQYLIPQSLVVLDSKNNVLAKGHLCFTVKDIIVTSRKILELGGSLPFDFVYDDELKPIVAYVLDPDGIPIELNASQ
jgi:catechol 2,3-dioxygenase-like lactoylglutathione lyase family enzyme